MTSLDFPVVTRPLPEPQWFYPPPVAEAGAHGVTVSEAMTSAAAAAHDTTRLLAALEEIEARRAAIEWLLEADLLRLCLV